VEVLLRTYVRCLDGQHDIAKRRIMEALDDPARDDSQSRAAQPDSDKQYEQKGRRSMDWITDRYHVLRSSPFVPLG
jgi:hypothetical protein